MAGRQELIINKKLPQIIIPKEKLGMFIDWWDNDIRFQSTVPHAFNEGYLRFSFIKADLTSDFTRKSIKAIAKFLHKTYREIENHLIEINNQETVLYFKFLSENKLYIERYEGGIKKANGTCEIGNKKEELELKNLFEDFIGEIYKYVENIQDKDERLDKVNYFVVCILITALWYIATSRSTKYIYNKTYTNKPPKKGDKRVIDVKPIKTINTPIYDMGKVKYVTTDKLITRRKGWTYSHAFQVHGHYRHYKSGKTIFIDSYIKGKGKELRAQKTILEPEVSNE